MVLQIIAKVNQISVKILIKMRLFTKMRTIMKIKNKNRDNKTSILLTS